MRWISAPRGHCPGSSATRTNNPAAACSRPCGSAGDRLAVEQNRSLGRLEDARDQREQRALAASVCHDGNDSPGKSTLLSLISGILQPTEGAVLLDGKPVTGRAARSATCCSRIIVRVADDPGQCPLGAEIQRIDMARRASARRRSSTATALVSSCSIYRASFPRNAPARRARPHTVHRTRYRPARRAVFGAGFPDRLALADEVADILRRERKTAILVTHDIGEAIAWPTAWSCCRVGPAR